MRVFVANEGFASPTSGIGVVMAAYKKYLPEFGVEFVDSLADCDIVVSHVIPPLFPIGNTPFALHSHGVYWTGEPRPLDPDLWRENQMVISALRMADNISVPSEWVADALRRDMHLSPTVIPHGVDASDWLYAPSKGYTFWNKNRVSDACDPSWVSALAKRFPDRPFVTTFSDGQRLNNVVTTGLVPKDGMRLLLAEAGVYLSTTKETFGIGILEAMASQIPVLAFDEGGARDLVLHKRTGYLARPGDLDDLAAGLEWCLANRTPAGHLAREIVKSENRWKQCVEEVYSFYQETIAKRKRSGVTVVIPLYNKQATVERAIKSALACNPERVIVVDNNSTDKSLEVARQVAAETESNVFVMTCERQGVAYARNVGITAAETRYVCCLDADDALLGNFLEICVAALERDRELGIAYTPMLVIRADGREQQSAWPPRYSFDDFLKGRNQVPTCSVFRKEVWERIGGYRQRYAPDGAGAEDAEFFLRMGARGYKGELLNVPPLFAYSVGSGIVSGNPNYREVDWRYWHAWTRGARQPMASVARPRTHSHPARSFDNPKISVIIPCAEKHRHYLIDALDSLEAQKFEDWEAIVLCDGFKPNTLLRRAFPFVRWIAGEDIDKHGPASLRNHGALIALADDLLFLDADDFLDVNALENLHNERLAHPYDVIYGDYNGMAFIDPDLAAEKKREGALVGYDPRDGYACIKHKSPAWDCERAQRQPNIDEAPYIWCLVTSLIPRALHEKLNGFDNIMESWEDWDYWIRAAQSGACFTHIDSILVNYRFFSGSRREFGRQIAKPLLSYMVGKRGNIMPCGGCGGRARASQAIQQQIVPVQATARYSPSGSRESAMTSNDLVMVKLHDGNIGTHSVIGVSTRTSYGFRVDGEEFLVNVADYNAMPDKYVLIDGGGASEPVKEVAKVAIEPKMASRYQDSVTALALPHITAAALRKNEVTTIQQVFDLGMEGLIALHGIGERSALMIYEAAQEHVA